MFLIDLHGFLGQPLFVLPVLLLKFLQLGLHGSHSLGGTDLLQRQRCHRQSDDDREKDDRHSEVIEQHVVQHDEAVQHRFDKQEIPQLGHNSLTF